MIRVAIKIRKKRMRRKRMRRIMARCNQCCGSFVKRLATPLGSGGVEGHGVRTVVFVAISFQLVFSGYRAIQNLQSSLNEENGLGVISLAVLYGAWIFSGFLTPTVLRILTTKGTLMVSWVCHILYIACTFFPAWRLIVPASFLVGIFQAPLWTSQSLYIAACGYSIGRSDSGSVAGSRSTMSRFHYHVFSRLNGIFFAIYETSQIVGNLISSLVLQQGKGNRTEGMHFSCGKGDCPAGHNATDFEEPEDWALHALLTVYITFSATGLLVTYIFVEPLPKGDWGLETTTRKKVTSFFVTLRSTNIGWLVPMFIFQGVQQAMLFSEFTRSYISCPLGIHMVGFVMATHGATIPLTTWLFSRAVKHSGRYVLFLLAVVVNVGLMAIMYEWTPHDNDLPFIFLVPIAWGVSEGIWFTQTSSLISAQYQSHKEAAFAIYHLCRSVGLAFIFAISQWLCTRVKVDVGITLALLGHFSYTVFELLTQRREKLRRLAASPNGTVSQLALSTVSSLPGNFRPQEAVTPTENNNVHNLESNNSVNHLVTVMSVRWGEEEMPENGTGKIDRIDDIDAERENDEEEEAGYKMEEGEELDDNVFVNSFPISEPIPVPGEAGSPTSLAPLSLEVSRLPSVASSSTSILSTLALMAHLNYSEEENEFVDSLPAKTLQRLSASINEEICYF